MTLKRKNFLKLVFALALCQAAGAAGGLLTVPAIPEWYDHLQKPFFTPPHWIFAPVWTVLYTLMALAAYRVWTQGLKDPAVRMALVFFLIQLALNGLWPFLFFGLRSPLYGLGEIFVLWLMILVTILQFLKVSRSAGWMLLPYLLWVSFACSLNLGFFLLNR